MEVIAQETYHALFLITPVGIRLYEYVNALYVFLFAFLRYFPRLLFIPAIVTKGVEGVDIPYNHHEYIYSFSYQLANLAISALNFLYLNHQDELTER